MNTRLSKKSTSRRIRLSRSSRLGFETLEGRSLLAGDVQVTNFGGSLVITGTADADDITITSDATVAGKVTITGNNGTTIEGEPSLEFTSNDIRVNLGAGDDVVTIEGNGDTSVRLARNLSIDLGSGDNTLNASGGSKVTGNVRVTAGTGNDTIAVADLDANDLFFSLGNGTANVDISGGSAINGSLQVIAGNAGVDPHAVVLSDIDVGNNVRVALGNGDSTVTLDDLRIDNDLSVTTGAGDTTVSIGATTALSVDDVTVRTGNGDATVTLNGGTAGLVSIQTAAGGSSSSSAVYTANVTVSDVTINESLSVRTGNGDDNVTVAADVAGSLLISTSHGDDTVVATGTVDGVATFLLGNGDNNLTLGGGASLDVGGTVVVHACTGDLTLTVADVDVNRALIITAGKGHHTVNLGDASATLDVATDLLFSSIGSADINLNNASVGGSLSLLLGTAGAQASSINVGTEAAVNVARNATLRTGNNGSAIVLGGVTIGRDLSVTTGSGEDTVTLAGLDAVGDFSVGGTTRLSTGSGIDTVTLGNTETATTNFANTLTILTGGGADVLSLDENVTGAIFTSGRFSIDGGAGADELTVVNGTAFDPTAAFFARRLRGIESVLT